MREQERQQVRIKKAQDREIRLATAYRIAIEVYRRKEVKRNGR